MFFPVEFALGPLETVFARQILMFEKIRSHDLRTVVKNDINLHTLLKTNTNECQNLFCFISSLFRFLIFCN